jgi:arginine decarboxylase-like protein
MPIALKKNVKETIVASVNFRVDCTTSINLGILARKENRSKVDELRFLVQQRIDQLRIEQQQQKRERSPGDTADISVKGRRVDILSRGSVIG